MKNHALMAAGLWLEAVAGFGAEGGFTVVVFDYVGLPGRWMKSATGMSHQVFQEAGVETNWSVCPCSGSHRENCTLPPEGSYLRINVESGKWPGVKLPTLMGWVPRESEMNRNVAYVYYTQVSIHASKLGWPVSQVLASVSIHELSHLLGLEHAGSGLMHNPLQWQDVKDVTNGRAFTPNQAQQLRGGASCLSTILPARAQ